MSTTASSNLTSGFIDLATYDELEKYQYGGPDATAYFVSETRKSTWFTQVPVTLTLNGTPTWGADFHASVSRAGDYLLSTWARIRLPEFDISDPSADTVKKVTWTEKLGHNIFEEVYISFNDLVAEKLTSEYLDFWSAFTTPASKQAGYSNMIGDVSVLHSAGAQKTDVAGVVTSDSVMPAYTLNIPLPFFYSRDSGVALPCAALPYNEIRIGFKLRYADKLLTVTETTTATGAVAVRHATASDFATGQFPHMSEFRVWANYAIVSNDERVRMGCGPRDILIEQVQHTNADWDATRRELIRIDVRFSHAIKVLFFAVRNKSVDSQWSNYTTRHTAQQGTGTVAYDPVLETSIIYENTHRLTSLGSDYFSLVQPYYHAPAIPEQTGLHMYSYSLDFYSTDPMGSTNYGKLTNVSIENRPATVARHASNGLDDLGVALVPEAATPHSNTFQLYVNAVCNNIIRISGGALGFPVL